MKVFQDYVDANKTRFLDELKTLCAQPTIAAHDIGLEETATLVEQRLESLGAEVRRFVPSGGAPILCAELGQGKRSILIYNHYDVQPPDPVDEWISPPFKPEIRDGRIFARGVADDKGDLLCRLQAIEAYQSTVCPLPLRLRFLIEGEEEIGSPHLGAFADQHPDLLEADGCLWETGQKDAARRFVLELGVKGICYVELRVKTAANDLHSMWGGVIPNAAWRLTWALSTLKDTDDNILIDGLMDFVQHPTRAELEHLETLPFDVDQIKADYGLDAFIRNLGGVDLLAKHFYEPTCTVCGLISGYQERGLKTVLPYNALAKLDFRLVPNLTPELVVELLRAHLDRQGFSDVEVAMVAGMRPARSSMNDPFVKACVQAAQNTYGIRPVMYPTSPGSGPMYDLARETPTVMAGVANANSRLHAPNENILVKDYLEGIRFVGELIRSFASE